MRNLLKISVLLLSLLPWSRSARAQFQTAVFPETNNPALPGSADRAQTINAYSYSNVTMEQGGVYTLNIHAWNSPDPTNPNGSSIAWTQIDNTGVGSDNSLATFMNKESVDIVLTQTPWDSVYALMAYYEPGVGHFLDTYVWEEAGNALTLRQTKQLSSATNFGWIHIDANSLDSFVVSWEEGGRLFAQGGQSKNISGIYPELASDNVQFLLPDPIQQPDVAMSNCQDLGQLMSHFVYLDFADNVYESRYNLNDLFVNAGSTTIVPLLEDSFHLKGANMPRIDCPDHSDYDDWSYVLEGRTSGTPGIHSAVQAYVASPTPTHFFLTDGSLTDGGGNPVADLATAKGLYYPVVAYDADWRYIYYAWDIQDVNLLSPYSTNNAYIGFRMRYNGKLMTNRYWFLQTTPADASYFAGIALSGQNDATDSLYMAFTKNSGGNYYIGCKNVEWGSPTGSFRPGATSINDLKNDNNLFAFPNPFSKGFALYATDIPAAETFEGTLSDINGRVIKMLKGNIDALNKELEKNNLNTGVYLLDIQSSKIHRQIKLFKQ